MATTLRDLKFEILQDGEDLTIDSAEFERIKKHLENQACVTPDELKTLTEMRTEARRVCPEFDEFFFTALRDAILKDGMIDSFEHFQLLRLLYGGGGIDSAERKFLQQLRAGLKHVSPEFEALYQQAMRDAAR